jgi:DNA polymerase-3 subunit epsilon
MVKDAPPFAEVWAQAQPILHGATTLLAHNAGFDQAVLHACCVASGLDPPSLPFDCTVRIAKRTWTQSRYDLASLCKRLKIPLNHHDALSDAEACARIAMAACPPRLFE